MLDSVILVFVLLGTISYFVGRRYLLYPPVLYCFTWALALLTVALFQNYFFKFLPETLAFFSLSAVVFSGSSWVATMMFQRKEAPSLPLPGSRKLINLLWWAVIIGTPLSFYWLYTQVVDKGVGFLIATRTLNIESNGTNTGLMLVGLVGELSSIVMLMVFYDSRSSRKMKIWSASLALINASAFGSKATSMSIIMALVAAHFIKTRTIRWKMIFVTGTISLVLLGAVNFFSHFSGDTSSRLESVMLSFPLYESGGVVGFDRVMRDPTAVPHFNQLDNNLQRIFRKLGDQRAAVLDNSEFVKLGPDPFFEGNVYTLLWNYLNWGLAGTLAAVGVIAFICTWCYHRALSGHMISAISYPFLAYSIAFSTFTEYFASRMYFFFKVAVICWVIYYLPKLIPGPNWLTLAFRSFKVSIHKLVQDDLRKHSAS